MGFAVPALAHVQQQYRHLTRQLLALLEDADAILSPTCASGSRPHEDPAITGDVKVHGGLAHRPRQSRPVSAPRSMPPPGRLRLGLQIAGCPRRPTAPCSPRAAFEAIRPDVIQRPPRRTPDFLKDEKTQE
ncbi:MAG: hypothetical protein R2838_23375 [Caldilineaceae bacterium]